MMTHQYDDDDNFEEDSYTFDFSDETEGGGVAGSSDVAGGAVYRVYEGEDFGQYLDDDDSHHVMSLGPQGPQLDGGVGGGGGGGTDTSRRRKSTALLRETFGRLLMTVGGGGGGGPGGGGGRAKAAAQPQNPGYRIQDVSFADCKMGSSVLLVEPRPGHSAAGSDSGIDSRSGYSLETESDLGPPSRSASAPWWDVNTLSSRNQTSASALELRRNPPPPSSFPSSSSGKRVLSRGSPLDASGVNDDNIVRSQQQRQRQQQQHYPKSSDTDRASSSDGVKRLSNPFRKIYKTLNRRKSTNLPEMSYNQDYEDIRL